MRTFATVTTLFWLVLSVGLLPKTLLAFTDFHALSGPHQRTVLSDGTIHLSHEVYHTFEAHGTYFSAKYVARHEPKWNFVRLDLLEPELPTKLKCGTLAAATDLVILHPSAALVQALSARTADTLVTASPKFHCRMKPIFRHVSAVQFDADGDKVVLQTVPARYETVFRDLKVSISTNHSFGAIREASASEIERHQQQAPSDIVPAVSRASRGFQPQVHWWDKVKSAVSRAFHDGVNDVKKAASDVKNAVVETGKTIDDVVHGDFNINAADPMSPGVNYNANEDATILSNQLVNVQFSAGASLVVSPSINFELDVQGWHLQNVEVFFEGDAQISVTALFKATAEKKVKGGKDPLDTINFDPITFMLGDIPIVIHPSIPINLDAVLNIDGQVEIGVVLAAQASIQIGVGYSPSTGHRLIHSIPTPTFTHAITPKTYEVDAGITVTVQPVFSVSIDSILSGNIALSISGEVLFQSNPTCIFDLTVNAQGLLTASADIGITVDGHSIVQIPLASSTLWSQTYPLYSYCKANPDKSDFSGSIGHHHKFLAQNTTTTTSSGSSISTNTTIPAVPVDHSDHCIKKHKWLRETVVRKLGDGNIGKVWTGTTVNCGATDLLYSLQFGLGDAENSSVALVTLTKVRPPEVPVGRGFATATVQVLYQSPTLPEAGRIQAYTLINASDIYVASTNVSELGFDIPPSFLLLFSPTNIRHARLDSPLTCGPVGLKALEVNNDESAFTTLGSAYGGSSPASADNAKAPSTNVAWIAATASCAAVAALAIIVAGVVSIKSRRGGKQSPSSAEPSDATLMENLTVSSAQGEERTA